MSMMLTARKTAEQGSVSLIRNLIDSNVDARTGANQQDSNRIARRIIRSPVGTFCGLWDDVICASFRFGNLL